jgi:hypothetical protein
MELSEEKNISNNTNNANVYEKLSQDVHILNTLFTDLNYIVKEQGEYLDSIENNISESKENVIHAHEDIVAANISVNTGLLASISNIKYSSVGAGLGAIVFLYNPYLAIGTICLGGFLGFTIGDKIKQNSLKIHIDKVEGKKE